MKNILFLAAAVMLTACGGSSKNSSGGHAARHDQSEACGDNHHGEDHEPQADCNDHDHSHDHDHGHSHGGHAGHSHGYSGEIPGGAQEIVFTREQAELAGLRYEKVQRGPFRQVIETYGEISPAPGDRVSVVAPSEGVVSFSGSALAEGAKVGAGVLLFTVSSSRISGGDLFAVNRASMDKARADYERAKRLREDNIVSEAELDALSAEYESARIRYESLTEAGTGRGAAVTSPVSGYIYGIRVDEGQYVQTGEILATIGRSRTMELRAEVPQRYYSKVAAVTDANFTVPSSDSVFNISGLGGSLISVGSAVGASRPTIPVVFRFPYDPAILTGAFAEVRLLGALRNDVLTLPLSAVTEQQGLYYVYIRTGEDTYRRCEVTIGGSDGRRVEVLSGLAPGDQVVVRGAVNVRMASASGSIPHSHEH
ncbi:MAG: efflux RND transporter periplasmic adaptor subunit [Rikenellaceae bacterium]|nr:efflux RND transporter periplasmic adaptor subunit [Rikenellaceae bacterium]